MDVPVTYFPSVSIMVVNNNNNTSPLPSSSSSTASQVAAMPPEDVKKVVDYTYQCMQKVLSIRHKYVIAEGITAYSEKQMIRAIDRLKQKCGDGKEDAQKMLKLVVGYDGEFFFYSVSLNLDTMMQSIFLSETMDDMHTFLKMREVIQDPNDVDIQAMAQKVAVQINKECEHIHASIRKYISIQRSMERYVWTEKGPLKIVE
jgi:hypothetical protein